MPIDVQSCTRCSLWQTRKKAVPGEGSTLSPLFFCGESPGSNEDRYGKPFYRYAKAGREFTKLLQLVGLHRDNVYVTNILHCHPPDDRDPYPEEIAKCSIHLERELALSQARIIVPMGRHSTRYFLGDVDMEQVHGIPFTSNRFPGRTIVPTYHPAGALHSPGLFLAVQEDFRAVANVLRGVRPPRHIDDPFEGKEDYKLATAGDTIHPSLPVAIDTENLSDGSFWGLSYSQLPGFARVVKADQHAKLQQIAEIVRDPSVLVYLHNSLHDLPILKSVGIVPVRFADTMVMAYLLQSEPQGLKPLAYRLAGMRMQSYVDTVGPYTRDKIIDYLTRALAIPDIPKPDPVILWVKGVPKIKQPQHIQKKILGIMRDMAKDPPADPWYRWMGIDVDEGRSQVEDVLGRASPGDVGDLPEDVAIYYSARDADATIRIAPLLWARLEEMELTETFWRDMRAIPMVNDMHETGILPDLNKFEELSTYFEWRMVELQTQIDRLAGRPVNPQSWMDVKSLLYDELKLKVEGEKKAFRRRQ